MSSEAIIDVAELGKCYQTYEKPHHRLLQMLFSRLGRTYHREFWALRDVTFSIPKGKIVGILGKNGAGKSTLLQIICGTLTPSHGDVNVRGRVAALLELGSGFNPEFTGVENVYMNAQLLGMTREQTDAKLEAILAFADIGDFVRQPVKTYSSGMFARLAFSVVIHVEPDILIVDEALSVGDAWFQHKSMARMRQLMESGCTVLFVSHSIDAVRALCDEAIWMERGGIKMQGNVTEVTNAYMNDVFIEHNRITLQASQPAAPATPPAPQESSQVVPQESKAPEAENIQSAALGLDGGRILRVRAQQLRNSDGEIVEHLGQGEKFSLEFELEILQPVKNVSVGFLIKDQFGQELTGESYFNTQRHSLDFEAGRIVRFVFDSTMLLRGGQSYSVALRINQVSKWDRSDNVVLYADELAMVFDVLADSDAPMWFKFKMPFEVSCQ
jgi:lipopolysaccharide transport system ATP-binding protein